MEKTQFLSEEAKKKIAELQSEIKMAKNKIRKALNNDLGINYIVWTDNDIYERVDFSKSLDVVYPYLEVIKNCYACMDEIFKKSIETEKYNKENRNPMQSVCQSSGAKHNAAENAAKEAFNEFIEQMKSHRMAVLKMDYEDEDESEIKIGDRVKLKGDSNSPEMTVTENISAQLRAQNGIKTNTGDLLIGNTENDFLQCRYFDSSKKLITHEFHIKSLYKPTPVEPQTTNKQ